MSEPQESLSELLRQPLARVGRHVFDWPALLAWAELLGLAQPCWRELAHAQALLAAAQARGEVPAQDDLQAAANAWRYERGLITAEETQRWLTQRGLDLEGLGQFLSRRLLLAQHPVPPPELLWPPADDPAALASELWAEGHFSGQFRHLVLPALWRALVAAFILHRGELDAMLCARAREGLAQRFAWEPAALQAGAFKFAGPAETLEEMIRWEACYQRHCDDIASLEDCRRRLPAMRPSLIRLKLECAEFRDEDAAREARLCVEVDGESLAAVAVRAEAPWQRLRQFSGELPAECREALVSATVGVCVGPLASAGETVHLWRVLRKEDPSLADPEVCQRVRESLITDTFAQYVNDDVQWLRFTPD